MDRAHMSSLRQVPPAEVYKQHCEDFRDLNRVFWRVPFVAMSLTGGIVVAVATLHFSAPWQSALLYFLALCNVAFIVIIWRVRAGVMQRLLLRIYAFEGRPPPKTSYHVMITFTALFGVTIAFSIIAAINPGEVFSHQAPERSAVGAAAQPAASAKPATPPAKSAHPAN